MSSTVRDVSEVTKLLDQYGPVMTILAIFLVIFIALIFFVLKQQANANAKMREDNSELMKNLLNTNREMLDNALKKIAPPVSVATEPKVLNLMETYSKINESLKDNCRAYLDKTTADRIAIYLFHNGTHTTHGFPFFKFSCICEYITKGTLSRMKDHLDFPINLMGDMVTLLMRQGEYYEFSEASKNMTRPIDPMIYKLLTSDSNSFIVCAIFDSDNNIMGFILSEFNRSILNDTNIQIRKDIMADMAKSVSPILEFSEFNKNYKGGSL